MCTKDTINVSAWATDMGYAIALKITDINFSDLVQIHLFVFCQSGPPKPTRPLTLNIYLLLGTKTRGVSINSIAINPLDTI